MPNPAALSLFGNGGVLFLLMGAGRKARYPERKTQARPKRE
ncbi:hypothetical protein predicted by Glimmer/Critica [Acetobacter ghanensis]|uniref:Uncharacterized protein n=1 Tax=Acetobacter ghanensis TaxID=431306 RepID=A0A0U5BLE8_9PROT|nr:hypothetical protein predicted by Glimmer/Critica [Acetobacter ghanensis]